VGEAQGGGRESEGGIHTKRHTDTHSRTKELTSSGVELLAPTIPAAVLASSALIDEMLPVKSRGKREEKERGKREEKGEAKAPRFRV
jgi:hypothetical protein